MEDKALALALIGLLGIACQWIAWWTKLPAILFLLVTGIVVGPVAGWLDPDALLGDLLFPMISLAVAVILFEGSLTLRFESIRGMGRVVRNLVGPGLLVTWLVVTLAARWFVGFEWETAALFGALMTVTGPTVILPMLRTVRPNARVAELLRWEGIVIDPIGALFAVIVFEFIVAAGQTEGFLHAMAAFGGIILAGLVTGAAGGYLFGLLLRRRWFPEYLRDVTSLVVLAGVFTLSNTIEHESGLLAVTVLGIWLANMRGVRVDDILDFKESLSILLISALFVLLAARLSLDDVFALGWGAIAVLAVVQLVARPLKIAIATAGSQLNWREKAILAWIGPRGIVAAAVSALLAPALANAGFADANLIVPLTFVVIIGTVGLQSATARPLAKLLGVAEPEPLGVLVIGANRFARMLGTVLREQGFRVQLADTSWEDVSAARFAGLPCFFGDPVSELADRQLDLTGIGKLLALTPRRDLNALAAERYAPEFGRANVYRLAHEESPEDKDEKAFGGNLLFGAGVTYRVVADAVRKGAAIRETAFDPGLDWTDFKANHPDAIPLFAITPRGELRIFRAGGTTEPAKDWRVFALQPESETVELAETAPDAV